MILSPQDFRRRPHLGHAGGAQGTRVSRYDATLLASGRTSSPCSLRTTCSIDETVVASSSALSASGQSDALMVDLAPGINTWSTCSLALRRLTLSARARLMPTAAAFPTVVFFVLPVLEQRLDAPLRLDRRRGRVDPPQQRQSQGARQVKPQQQKQAQPNENPEPPPSPFELAALASKGLL
jgi:hypothetical protein